MKGKLWIINKKCEYTHIFVYLYLFIIYYLTSILDPVYYVRGSQLNHQKKVPLITWEEMWLYLVDQLKSSYILYRIKKKKK